ncbi:MAG: 2-oxo acid dehydrogenase subunit E2 [Chloroflexi bacterium]|nr:2-oxo acid dehydrogenase subunit E2 [Chloroflexota bacterium]
MPTKVLLPIMGEGVTDATITAWLKKEGDTVAEYDALVEVNTDKVDSEIPSPVAGTVLKTYGEEGDVVLVEAILAWIGEPGEEIPEDDGSDTPAAAAPAKVPAKKSTPASPTPTPAAPVAKTAPASPPSGGRLAGFVSPVVARVAAEHNVDLSQVAGSGSGGRITKEDVLAYIQTGGAVTAPAATLAANGERSTFLSPVVIKLVGQHNVNPAYVTGTGKDGRVTKQDIEAYIAAGKPVPATATAPAVLPARPPGPEVTLGEIMKLGPVRKAIAEHMVMSRHTSAHVTTVMEVDMSAVAAHRDANKAAFAQSGAKLTYTAYMIAAIVAALKAYPIVNSSWAEEGILVHQDINVGMAVAFSGGLIVPVIKQAGTLSLLQISQAINDLATRARDKHLKPDEVKGGTFTLTNHGTSGSLFATPIINQPQCAILGTGLIQKRAVVINDAIAIRPMVYIGLTFDHRILDGAVADYFLGTIKDTLDMWH